jgi:hypothetical protein
VKLIFIRAILSLPNLTSNDYYCLWTKLKEHLCRIDFPDDAEVIKWFETNKYKER